MRGSDASATSEDTEQPESEELEEELEEEDIVSGQGLPRDQIQFTDLHFEELISKSSNEDTYRAKLWSHQVAVKMMRVEPGGLHAAAKMERFHKEIEIMRSLRHPNIVEFMGVSFYTTDMNGFMSQNMLCFVTEYFSTGNMEQFLGKKKQRLSWKRLLNFAKDIASGLNWLHHKGFTHRDLRPSHLWLTNDYRIKIGGFALSHITKSPRIRSLLDVEEDEQAQRQCYSAPEVLAGRDYDSKADVFSFGVLLCEMISGRYPYTRQGARASEVILTGGSPSIPSGTLASIHRLIDSCCKPVPLHRPSMTQVLEHLNMASLEIQHQATVLEEEFEEIPPHVRMSIMQHKLRLAEVKAECQSLRGIINDMELQGLSLRSNFDTIAGSNATDTGILNRLQQERDELRKEAQQLKRKSADHYSKKSVP